MDLQKKQMDVTVRCISALLEQLNQGNDLSEQDCSQVIANLEKLERLAYVGKEGEQKDMDMNIEELLLAFNSSADESKKLLGEMLAVISDGKVPGEAAVKSLDSLIHSLRQKYDSIYSMAQAQISEDEMPEQGASAAEYAEAVRNSAAIRYKRQLENIKRILEDFIAVQSLVANYAAALLPYQEQAKALVSGIENEEIPDVDHMELEITGPKVFLETLACENIDSDEGMELLDQVSEYYSRRVQNGLAAGKYFIPEKAEMEPLPSSGAERDTEEADQEDMPEPVSTDNSDQPEDAGLYSDQPEEAVLHSDQPEDAGLYSDQPEDAGLHSDKPEGAGLYPVNGGTCETDPGTSDRETDGSEMGSGFVQKVIASGLLLDETDPVGLFSKDISPNEEKKVTTSVFQNDVRKGNEKAVKEILKEICATNNVTARSMKRIKGMPEELARSVLDYLLKKGYLRKYTVTLGGYFYCASPKLMKALSFKDAARMTGVRQRAVEDWGCFIEDKNTGVVSRITYGRLYCESISRLKRAGRLSFTLQEKSFTDAFILRVFPTDKSAGCDLNIGVFWDNTEECDSFMEDLGSMLEAGTRIERIVFAALNTEKARCLAELLLDTFGDRLSSEEIDLYSFADNHYSTYPEDEVTEGFATSSLEDEGDNDSQEEEPVEHESAAFAAGKEPAAEKTVSSQVLPDKPRPQASAVETVSHGAPISGERKNPARVMSSAGSDSDHFMENVMKLISSRRLYGATAYAKAFSLRHPEYTLFYNQLAHAVNDPMGHCSYSTDNVFNLIESKGEFEDALVMSTAIRTFFSNQVRYDYNIKSFYSGIKEYKLLSDYPALSNVVYSLMEFKDSYQKGMDAYADYRSRSKAELEQEMRKLQQEARSFYENSVIGRKKEKASQKRFLETKRLIFSVGSDFGQYIKAVVDGDDELLPLVTEFLQDHFYEEDSIIGEDTIDGDKLWAYIVAYWEEAGKRMMYRRHADLMSHLRSNIISTTTKAVQLLARWCDIVNRLNNHAEDEGDEAYKKARKKLMENLETSIGELEESCENAGATDKEKAGVHVLIYTLREILDCINGSYKEDTRKYFYKSFLLTDDLMLDEDYIPDLDMHSSTMQALDPMVRIFDHVQKTQNGLPDYRERLTAILDDKGDDYGAARLIVGYLMAKDPAEDLEAVSGTIDSGEAYARETAELRKDDFIGELELAQSYGQIDNSIEDKKEKILQIVDEWYEWAVETSNYGFFKRVMDGYLAEIKEEAKAREKDLLEQLDIFKSAAIPGLSADAKEKRIARIQGMIKVQNYTVAEDLLARANVSEEEHEELIEEDFLKEFLDNYDDYYQPVATHKASFANLVSSRTRNKEERGAKRLADNWLPGGSLLGKDRLSNLLTCFGFKPESVKPLSAIGKFENFSVLTAKAKGGQGDNHTHPIAAFGSGAAVDGFRVVCINGAYDADGLIDVMKQIGNAKHTLILLDCALSKSERRRLARKSKNALGDKLFGVIDRTVMMFLVRNFDETKMNRMLVSLITPFGYYQPYVWESANVMPPEIFMGRKHELEKIKSPTGVNIVYGGRQLGKSALLKKAKEDINWDENGNRAVLVDIKGLDYKKAARKTGHALFDEEVLEQDIDTDNWDDLARVVKRRLQSGKNRIPYLLLLLDEADVFIESCGGDVNYQPFDALKEIQSIGAGRFKFVIAGLRNIVRFKREALGNNSVLTHLEPMTVKPFNTSEARELMEIPLHYLGLRFPKEKESLITLILATANYFPGLIQMYCAKLINAMRSKDYANYDEVDTPIYEVSEEHIKKVLADPEFMQQIREKYEITLKLDEDNYYYLIALLMAFLYHNNGYNEGYSAMDIKKAGIDLEIAKIASLENTRLEAFMEELTELNVLRNTDKTHYLFTRFTFFQMMGTRGEVDDMLEEYMGD